MAISGLIAMRLYFWMVGGVMGVTPDSIRYLQVADRLLDGQGAATLGQHWPPGYSLAIALGALLRSGDVYRGAYWLQVGLILLNTLLLGTATWLASNRRLVALVTGVALFLATGPILKIHAMIWSEPLFFSFMLGAFLTFALYVQRGNVLSLGLAGLFSGLAIMVRYAGFALIVPFFTYLLFLEAFPLRERLKRFLLFSAAALILPAAWLVRNLLTSSSAFGRGFNFLPVNPDRLRELVNTLFDFWLPYSIRPLLATPPLLLVFGLLVAGWIYLYLRSRKGEDWLRQPLYWQFGGLVFATAYIIFLLITVTYIDITTTIDSRMFSPVYVMLVVTILSLVSTLAAATRQEGVWWIFLVMTACLLFVKVEKAIDMYLDVQTNGRGFTSQQWENSQVIGYIEKLPDTTTIYSNGADVVWFKTGRDAEMIPKEVIGNSLPNPDFAGSIQLACQDLTAGRAVYAGFNKIARNYLPTPEDLLEICGPLAVEQLQDGVILKHP